MDDDNSGFWPKLKRRLIGGPRNIFDPSIFHKISLVPLLAWIGLGADGLSSSAYGPEEAFRAFGEHTYLALFLAFAMAFTVFVISYAYTKIIEHFPHGGGGYIVATHMLGNKAGVVSGSALLVDYVLTITISIAAAADALFSFIPLQYNHLKLPFAFFLVILMIIMNIRGVKESITILAPIFITFIITHAILLGYGIFSHVGKLGNVFEHVGSGLHYDLGTIGIFGVMAILLHGYSLGGGTYTGIEAVSNGLQIMREPHVKTGQRTMVYMATSLALTASGILLCYLLWQIKYVPGKTMNAVLAANVLGKWAIGPFLAFITIFAEGALLVLAAQAGFVDGPRVMSNMAVDYWMPHRFASLSDRLTMQNGITVMGVSAAVFLIFTRGSVSALVVMYSINVFLTFSMSQFGMTRFFFTRRKTQAKWKRHISVHIVGLVLCLTILIVTTLEKFGQGGWITLLITAAVIAFCLIIRRHYESVRGELQELDESLLSIPVEGPYNNSPLDPDQMTAIQLVNGYNGFGVHTFLSVIHNFPGIYKNFIFESVAVVDSGTFKGAVELENLKVSVRESLEKYKALARRLGFAADYRMTVGTDVVDSAVGLCKDSATEFPHSVVFAGQLTFRLEKFYHRILHNETAFAIQRRLHWLGITSVILPIRVGFNRAGQK